MGYTPFDKETSYRLATRYLKSGHSYQASGHYDKAIKYYNMSIESYPTAEAYTFRGWAYSKLGELEKAIESCKAAIDFDPNYGNPYNDIGAYLIQLKRYDEAEEYLHEALYKKQYKTPQYAYFNLGIVSQMRGKWFEARDYYKQAMDIDPTSEMILNAYYKVISLLN